jgi:hypothetical protein
VTQVLLQPTGGPAARAHYEETIQTPVPLEEITPFMGPEEAEGLTALYGSGAVPVWGHRAGAAGQNITKWERIQPGDIAIFAASSEIHASAVVTYKTRNSELAQSLWGSAPEGDTWEYIYFIDKVVPRRIPREVFNQAAGYSSKAPFRDFRVLSEAKSTPVIDEFQLATPAEPPDEVEDAVAAAELAAGRRFGAHAPRISPAQKKAIEMHAVQVATSHYQGDGWTVEYVGNGESYDLLCKREGKVLHVEVKGTRSDGLRVVLTRNEEVHAHDQFPDLSLFVVSGIELKGTKTSSGRDKTVKPQVADPGPARLGTRRGHFRDDLLQRHDR